MTKVLKKEFAGVPAEIHYAKNGSPYATLKLTDQGHGTTFQVIVAFNGFENGYQTTQPIDRFNAQSDTRPINIHISMNGPMDMTFAVYNRFMQKIIDSVEEAKEFLNGKQAIPLVKKIKIDKYFCPKCKSELDTVKTDSSNTSYKCFKCGYTYTEEHDGKR